VLFDARAGIDLPIGSGASATCSRLRPVSAPLRGAQLGFALQPALSWACPRRPAASRKLLDVFELAELAQAMRAICPGQRQRWRSRGQSPRSPRAPAGRALRRPNPLLRARCARNCGASRHFGAGDADHPRPRHVESFADTLVLFEPDGRTGLAVPQDAGERASVLGELSELAGGHARDTRPGAA